MKSKTYFTTSRPVALFCIWTLEHQGRLAAGLAMVSSGAMALLLVLVLAGRLGPVAASNAAGLWGASQALLVWLFLQARKKALLGIGDPVLRRAAHRAMLRNICARSKAHCPREAAAGAGVGLPSKPGG